MKPLWRLLFTAGSTFKKPNYLSILIYHRVLEEPDPLRPETIDQVQFKQQMLWVKQHFNVLPLYEAVNLLRQNQLPKRAVAISFDDGYLDNLTVAAPILKQFELPASFYISSQMLGTQAMWIDKIIEATRTTQLQSLQLDKKVFPLYSIADKQAFLLFFENHYKSLPLPEADELLERLLNELGQVEKTAFFMDEQQVRQLADMNMEIGSHGRHHRILSAVSEHEAKQEISISKREIEAIIGRQVKGFAYPNGKAPVDFNQSHMNLVEKSGYEYALSTNYGCSHTATEMYALKRFTPWRLSKNGFLISMFLNYWLYQEQPFDQVTP